MAITSYGYPGAITPGSVWADVQQVLGRRLITPGVDDWEPSINGSAARTVSLAPGRLGGYGVLDVSTALENVPLPEVGSGAQYFLVGANRVWGATNATAPGYVAGTPDRRIPTFPDEPGVQAFHPVALARVTAGSPTITDLVDLRAIAAEPGTYNIFDDLALELIAQPGVVAHNVVTKVTRRYLYNASGNTWGWEIDYPALTGQPPMMMIGRDDIFGTDLGSVNIEFYAGQAEVTSVQGGASAHMKGYLGGSNFSQAAAGNVAKIEVLKSGTYAIGARYQLSSSVGFRANLALNCPGLGYRRYGPVMNETAENYAGAYTEISATDILWFPAGASFQPKWSTYGTTRLRKWYMWMTKLSAE